jgi:hypothetical protein
MFDMVVPLAISMQKSTKSDHRKGREGRNGRKKCEFGIISILLCGLCVRCGESDLADY